MSFVIEDEKVLEKYESIWNKINNEFEQRVYDRKYLNTKLKSYNGKRDRKYLNTGVKSCNGKINTDFHGKNHPKRLSLFSFGSNSTRFCV